MTVIGEDDNAFLSHYGIARKSGRYPWGSGETEQERSKSFMGMLADLKAKGLSETEIARGFGMTVTELRQTNTLARSAKKQADISYAVRLKEKGMSNVAIGEKMGIPESSVRFLLSDSQKDKSTVLETTANMLRQQVAEKKYIDIGKGVENQLGMSETRLSAAVAMLKSEDYVVQRVQVDQLGTQNKTTIKVLAPPGTTYRDIVSNKDQIQQIKAFSDDGGRTMFNILPPMNIDSKRVAVRYAEEGGKEADGVIYVRPGVDDVSLGAARYAQVRVAVDGTHYLKGMAMYKEDMPKGVDLMFNTNKSDTGNKLDAMKPLKTDEDNPFGAVIRQRIEKDHEGKEHVTSVMNIVGTKDGSGVEGSWDTWSRSLSSQFLSKQSPMLASKQLDMTYERKKNELGEILSLTNPAVKAKLLESYADGADSSAVQLKAAALPRASWHVILPFNSMKETEIYAPNFNNGERVALVRYPHGGTFEIPELTVNNNHPEASRVLGPAKDAVGIHHKVAERLSGADFDGDAVLVIPNDANHIKSTSPLEALKGFDPQRIYKLPEGQEFSGNKQQLMGDVSNLITDMTIQGAPPSDIARAVKHSMVVIDAEKHNLNYKQSALDNNIGQLKEKYQGAKNAGASTLISRATSRTDINRRVARPAKDGGPIDRATGKKVFVDTGESYVKRTVNKKTGAVTEKTVMRTQKAKKLEVADNAHTLVSKDGGTKIESIYADHSNRLKDLANQARREMVATKPTPYSPSAKVVYKNEVASLNAKLNLAFQNKPLERQAQLIANATLAEKRRTNPSMDPDELKKVKFQALEAARVRTGAKKAQIEITDREWEAIQAGAITHHKLKSILDNTDVEKVKELATPRTQLLMTTTKRQRAEQMIASGYTQAEVASHLGVSLTTLKNSIGG